MSETISNWFTRWWDWIDERDIDKHLVSLAIMYGTIKVTEWSMKYAMTYPAEASSAGSAAIIAAVTGPYMVLQAAAIKFYFDSRTK